MIAIFDKKRGGSAGTGARSGSVRCIFIPQNLTDTDLNTGGQHG